MNNLNAKFVRKAKDLSKIFSIQFVNFYKQMRKNLVNVLNAKIQMAKHLFVPISNAKKIKRPRTFFVSSKKDFKSLSKKLRFHIYAKNSNKFCQISFSQFLQNWLEEFWVYPRNSIKVNKYFSMIYVIISNILKNNVDFSLTTWL
mgnify:CR=1 FL=1